MRYAFIVFGNYVLTYLGIEPSLPLIAVALTLCGVQDIKEILR